MLLGYARGSVGDVTFSRVKGQQVQKARNRRPNNPRTEAQVLQRAKFSGAGLFHKQLVSKFFKFAYEDKTERESDFNAFMRHNVGISPLIYKEATASLDYPVFAPFVVSLGSLPTVSCEVQYHENVLWGFVGEEGWMATEGGSSVADLTNNLITANPNRWQVGDIITIIIYSAPENGYAAPPTPSTPFAASCVISQFILSTSDTTLLGDILPGFDLGTFHLYRGQSFEDITTMGAAAFAVIHSRRTSGGLLVSSQSLVLSNYAEETYKSSNFATASSQFKQEIFQSWDAAALAVLEGGLAKQTADNSFSVVRFRYSSSDDFITVTPVNGIYSVPINDLSVINVEVTVGSAVLSSSLSMTPAITGINLAFNNTDAQFDEVSSVFTGYGRVTIGSASWVRGLHKLSLGTEGDILIQFT